MTYHAARSYLSTAVSPSSKSDESVAFPSPHSSPLSSRLPDSRPSTTARFKPMWHRKDRKIYEKLETSTLGPSSAACACNLETS